MLIFFSSNFPFQGWCFSCNLSYVVFQCSYKIKKLLVPILQADMTLIENKLPSVKVQSEDRDLGEIIMGNNSPICKIDETSVDLRNIEAFSGNCFLKK